MTVLPNYRRSERGLTLIMVMSVSAVLIVCLGAAMEYTSTIRKEANRTQLRQTAVAAADGVLEIAYANWREICRDIGSTGAPTVSNLSTLASKTITSSYYSGLPAYSGTYSVQVVDPRINPSAYPITAGTPPPAYGTDAVAANSGTGGSTTYTTSYYYLAKANVTVGPTSNALTVNASRVFELQKKSPWQWAIFYNDDLEINPGATMYVDGWVHTNGNLYTAYNELTFQNKVTYGSNWQKTFSPNDKVHSGGEDFGNSNYDSTLPPAQSQTYQPFGINPAGFDPADPNNTGYHELIELPVAGADPLSSQRYYNQAGIKVLINGPSNVTVYNAAGAQVTSSSTGSNKLIYDAVMSAISPQSSSLQDNREAATMTVTDVDVSKITAAVNASGTNFFNPKVLYVTDTTGTSSTKRAVRLKNGGILPLGGLTVASANPVYIQGDYNTGATSSTYSASDQPASNSPTSTWSGDGSTASSSNAVTGYDLQTRPAAVIADAVSILSNAWNDANSSLGTNNRTASNTTLNTAIVSGIAASNPSYGGNNSYSGGAENFPRFLENWGGRTFTYYGSMVELYSSKQATGRWGNGNVYSAPNRRWKFNTFFRTNPPPGTTLLINYNRGQWFVQ